ncbi:diguanylate cyclase (GGDEF) domain-containing protein [Ferrimonas sediminum]|uniref:Diguanylate cyclase (GGDEF) domain-containing protein n=1 Tax=Ferrimonas sediminum TaxID=718193 RepID=A0A1G8TMG7_9GAMM|nr:GGDEF domain-containing phosphodiesterase [Ferrimonas sediminum]SDJ42732.1 diguanylate cyclase (GGDEF) domain-containing protein [Ferrimonas sediminum]
MLSSRHMPLPAIIGLHWLTLISTVGFAIHHLVNSSLPAIGVVELMAAPLIATSLWQCYRRGKESRILLVGYSVLMMVAISTFTYAHGLRGLFFVFPVAAGLFCIMPFKIAGALGVLYSFVCFLAATHSVDVESLIRFSISVVFTYSFIWFFVHSQILSYHNLQRSHLTDPLTGLDNRRAMEQWLQKQPPSAPLLCVLQLNIDQFKGINQRYGRTLADHALTEMARRLKRLPSILRQEGYIGDGPSLISRSAGDEFVIGLYLAPKVRNDTLADVIRQQVVGIYHIQEHSLAISVTLGYSRRGNESASEKLVQASTAITLGKRALPGHTYCFSEEMAIEMKREAHIQQGLRKAMDEGAFELKFMPIHQRDKPWCTSAEALIRCTHPDLEGVGPDLFIPVAEKYGMIYELDLWVIEFCFREIGALKQEFREDIRDLRVAINISSLELNNPKLPAQIIMLANRHDIDLNTLDLELTETGLVSHKPSGLKMLTELRQHGIRIILDDFGTGYTAFNQLQHYPIDRLKIDRSFVNELSISGQAHTRSLVDVILRVAEIYGIPVTAEGVETQEQLNYLAQRGCHSFQGYYFNPPVALTKLIATRYQQKRSVEHACAIVNAVPGSA